MNVINPNFNVSGSVFSRTTKKKRPEIQETQGLYSTAPKSQVQKPISNFTYAKGSTQRTQPQTTITTGTVQQQQPQAQPQGAFDRYLQALKDSSAKTQGNLQANKVNTQGRYQNLAGLTKQTYGNQQEALKKQLELSANNAKNVQSRTNEYLKSIDTEGAASVAQQEQLAGEDLRSLGQSANEKDLQMQNIYANRGAADSFGNQGLTGEQSKIKQELLRGQTGILKQKEQNIAEINSRRIAARNQAKAEAESLIAEYDSARNELQLALANNPIELQKSLLELGKAEMDDLRELDAQISNDDLAYKKMLYDIDASDMGDNTKTMGGEKDLRAEYFNRLKELNFFDVASAHDKVNSTADNAAGDMSLIFAYMKMLDPQSVVREGEFATAQNSGSVPMQIQNIYNKALSGKRLTPEQRSQFRNEANSIYSNILGKKQYYDNYYGGLANEYGLSPQNVVNATGNYDSASGGQQTQGAGNVYTIGQYQVEEI